MEAIQPVGMSTTQVTSEVRRTTSSTATTASISTARIAGGNNINATITSMLQSIGGGLENDELLKALIALVIIAALLQESLKGFGSGSAQSLRALGSGIGDSTQFASASSSFSSFESTTTAYSTTTVTLADAGTASGAELGGRMDVTG